MRFITEFELNHPYTPTRENNSKKEMLEGMGKMIGESFGWNEKSSVAFTRHTLEIEAFPMDKWVEFKQRLFSEIATCNDTDFPVDGARILSWIKELESFGKPSGDAITNQQTNTNNG